MNGHQRQNRPVAVNSALVKPRNCRLTETARFPPELSATRATLTPARGAGLGANRGRETLDDDKPFDLALQEGVQERRIVTERHAAIRLTAGTEHVSMRQDAIPPKHLAVIDREQTNGTNAVKKLLA